MFAAKTACLKLAQCVMETADAQFATAKVFTLNNQMKKLSELDSVLANYLSGQSNWRSGFQNPLANDEN